MTEVAERHEPYVVAFDAFRGEAAFGSGDVRAARETAFRRFLDRGFPTTREEEWKHTNVTPVAETAFVRAVRESVAAGALAPYLFAGLPTVVLVNGRVSPARSAFERLPVGVTIRTRPDAALPSGGHAFADLNAAFFEDAVHIDIAPKTIVREPLHVLSITVPGRLPGLVAPRLTMTVGEAAQVSLIESYGSAGDGRSLTTAVTDILVGPGAIVDHVKIQRESLTAFHLARLVVHLSRASTFASRALTFGGRIARNDIEATLDGDGAECTLNGLYIATGESLVDTHTAIRHAAPHCPSHEVYKGIIGGRARAVFNGKIVVDQRAQKTDAKQTNKALLLSDDAQINTKPQLEIFADDVKCTHGAAIGQLDEDAMFYLRARGIGETDARSLLIHAFAGEILAGIKADAVRERMLQVMEEKLALG
jgi:Fe-S cluster assembly protein SufD